MLWEAVSSFMLTFDKANSVWLLPSYMTDRIIGWLYGVRIYTDFWKWAWSVNRSSYLTEGKVFYVYSEENPKQENPFPQNTFNQNISWQQCNSRLLGCLPGNVFCCCSYDQWSHFPRRKGFWDQVFFCLLALLSSMWYSEGFGGNCCFCSVQCGFWKKEEALNETSFFQIPFTFQWSHSRSSFGKYKFGFSSLL